MLSMFSADAGHPEGWDSATVKRMQKIEQFYFARRELPQGLRRRVAYYELLKLGDFTPEDAKTVLNQWNDVAKTHGISLKQEIPDLSDPEPTEPALAESPEPDSPSTGSISAIALSPVGQLLYEAGLVSQAQIEVVLNDQQWQEHLRFGEILALRGWLKQETVDFYVDQLPHLIKRQPRPPLGHYLKSAAHLDDSQIGMILREQQNCEKKFGEIVVSKGWLKLNTINWWLTLLDG